jgi:serine/threonine protein kinase
MESISSAHVVKLFDVLQTENNLYIVLEYCSLGDLDHALNETHRIESSDYFNLLIDVLKGFLSLISQGIIHRDLKPENIMVTKVDGKIVYKIGDFGFARRLKCFKREMLNSKVGTPLYMSPQLLNNDIYTSKSDIWSLAMVIYYVIYKKCNTVYE